MPLRRKPRAKPHPDQSHRSFAFWKDDIVLLTYCSDQTGLSQSEFIRRLIRIAASGKKLPTITKFPAHKLATKWQKEFSK